MDIRPSTVPNVTYTSGPSYPAHQSGSGVPGARLPALLLQLLDASELEIRAPLGFLAGADSIGKAALFLASDDSYYITGHNLVVDGGLTLR